MITLKFKVTETEVRLVEKSDKLISGNVEQIKCIFDLSSEYEGLIVRASFNGNYRNLDNGECFAPELTAGMCEIGVYGFIADGDKLSRRISPIPCCEYVYQGSYSPNSSQETASPTELEAYYAAVKRLIENITATETRTILDVTNGVDFDTLADGAYDIKGSSSLFNDTIPLDSGDILIKDSVALTIICKYGSYYIEDYNADSTTIANSYVPNRNEIDKSIEEAQAKNEQKIKETLSNILEFKLLTTEEEIAATLSFDENGKPNYNCRTMYAVLNSFLGVECYPTDSFVEFMMIGTDPDLDVFEQMEFIGTLATFNFDNFVTQEQLRNELNSKATNQDYGGYGNVLQLKNNTVFYWKKMSELTILLPSVAGLFHSIVFFDSPSPATILTAPAMIKFVGDDCTDGVLIPAENTSYEIDIKLVSNSTILAKVTAF